MELLRKAKETLRDTTREDLCTMLQSLGVQASLSERGRTEEKVFGRGSKGIIDISKGPIKWICVAYRGGGGGPGGSHYFIFGVPDLRLTSDFLKLRVKSFYKKTFPIFGTVTETCWKGNDMGSGLIDRLNGDLSLAYNKALVDNINIYTNSDHMCWVIVMYNQHDILKRDTADLNSLWGCCQTMAQHLLDSRLINY